MHFSPSTQSECFDRIAIKDRFLAELTKEQKKRFTNTNWEKDEHLLMQRLASDAAGCKVSLGEIKEAEKQALGHSDYSRKFCLYVAELTIMKKREVLRGAEMSPFTLEIYKSGKHIDTKVFEELPGLVVKVGRLKSSQLYLDDPSVNRIHAVIEYLPSDDYFRVVDLGSSAGTFLQGEQVSISNALTDGASLQFGVYTVLFNLDIPKALEESEEEPEGLKIVPPVILHEERPEFKTIVEECAQDLATKHASFIEIKRRSLDQKISKIAKSRGVTEMAPFVSAEEASINTKIDILKEALITDQAETEVAKMVIGPLGEEYFKKVMLILPREDMLTKDIVIKTFNRFFVLVGERVSVLIKPKKEG